MTKILIVEDEESVRLLFAEELSAEGYEVDTAENGEVALEKITKNKPDLITLDIKMPGMDGLELLDKIRQFDKEIPVIICTAYGTYKQDFFTWASDEYITKSADLTELKSKVKKLLKK
ncbi:MAG: response regulator [Candidatus Firestonebacteria bacterium]